VKHLVLGMMQMVLLLPLIHHHIVAKRNFRSEIFVQQAKLDIPKDQLKKIQKLNKKIHSTDPFRNITNP